MGVRGPVRQRTPAGRGGDHRPRRRRGGAAAGPAHPAAEPGARSAAHDGGRLRRAAARRLRADRLQRAEPASGSSRWCGSSRHNRGRVHRRTAASTGSGPGDLRARPAPTPSGSPRSSPATSCTRSRPSSRSRRPTRSGASASRRPAPPGMPFLVAEIDGEVVGFACCAQYRPLRARTATRSRTRSTSRPRLLGARAWGRACSPACSTPCAAPRCARSSR